MDGWKKIKLKIGQGLKKNHTHSQHLVCAKDRGGEGDRVWERERRQGRKRVCVVLEGWRERGKKVWGKEGEGGKERGKDKDVHLHCPSVFHSLMDLSRAPETI